MEAQTVGSIAKGKKERPRYECLTPNEVRNLIRDVKWQGRKIRPSEKNHLNLILENLVFPVLSDMEERVLQFVFKRTIHFGKFSESITAAQMDRGIVSKDGLILAKRIRGGTKAIGKAINSLEEKGIISIIPGIRGMRLMEINFAWRPSPKEYVARSQQEQKRVERSRRDTRNRVREMRATRQACDPAGLLFQLRRHRPQENGMWKMRHNNLTDEELLIELRELSAQGILPNAMNRKGTRSWVSWMLHKNPRLAEAGETQQPREWEQDSSKNTPENVKCNAEKYHRCNGKNSLPNMYRGNAETAGTFFSPRKAGKEQDCGNSTSELQQPEQPKQTGFFAQVKNIMEQTKPSRDSIAEMVKRAQSKTSAARNRKARRKDGKLPTKREIANMWRDCLSRFFPNFREMPTAKDITIFQAALKRAYDPLEIESYNLLPAVECVFENWLILAQTVFIGAGVRPDMPPPIRFLSSKPAMSTVIRAWYKRDLIKQHGVLWELYDMAGNLGGKTDKQKEEALRNAKMFLDRIMSRRMKHSTITVKEIGEGGAVWVEKDRLSQIRMDEQIKRETRESELLLLELAKGKDAADAERQKDVAAEMGPLYKHAPEAVRECPALRIYWEGVCKGMIEKQFLAFLRNSGKVTDSMMEKEVTLIALQEFEGFYTANN